MTETDLPQRRAFTRADGTINFRECLDAAKSFRRQIERSMRFATRRPWTGRITGNDLHEIGLRVRDLVADENARWDALSPSLRAAAARFDAAMDMLGTECRCDVSRRDAIAALAAERPALWNNHKRSGGHPFSTLFNFAAQHPDYATVQAEVFAAIVAHPDDRILDTMVALNPAGEALLARVRAARAHRRNGAVAA